MNCKTRKPRKIAPRSKAVIILNIVLNVLIIGILIRSVLLRNYDSAFICLLTILLFTVPSLAERTFHIKLPETLEVIVLLFIFCAEILGELGAYYIRYPYWDTMLHITWGFLCAALGFSLVDIINRNSKIKFSLSPVFVAIVAFCFSMTVGVIWEFFEFSADNLFNTDMQKDTIVTAVHSTELDPTRSNKVVSMENIIYTEINGERLDIDGYLDIGLYDTMEDLFVNFIGASVFSIIGYFYIKKRGRGRFASRFIPVVDNYDKDKNGGNIMLKNPKEIIAALEKLSSEPNAKLKKLLDESTDDAAASKGRISRRLYKIGDSIALAAVNSTDKQVTGVMEVAPAIEEWSRYCIYNPAEAVAGLGDSGSEMCAVLESADDCRVFYAAIFVKPSFAAPLGFEGSDVPIMDFIHLGNGVFTIYGEGEFIIYAAVTKTSFNIDGQDVPAKPCGDCLYKVTITGSGDHKLVL